MSGASIALLGVSGVGKSTFLASLSEKVEFMHAQAGNLIKDQRERQALVNATSEELRTGNTDDNQQLLISAYQRLVAKTENRVILDAHAIIDKGTYIDKVEIDVFRQLGFDLVIVLVAEPETIAEQRHNDRERTRPQLPIDEILTHQNLSNEHAIKIANSMKIPCVIISAQQVDFVAMVLSQLGT